MLRLLLRSWRRSATPNPAPSAPALSVEQYEAFVPVVTLYEGAVPVVYCTPTVVAKARAQTLFTKEPDTVEWIRTFQEGEVLLDVGANVGMYSIWAAKTRGVRVFAFEPESQNYALLYRNIVQNHLSALVTAYCAALSDEEGYSLLHLSDFRAGGSCHAFGAAQDHNLEPAVFPYTQGCHATTLDALVARGVLPVPTHVKIDVDGLEHKVIAGAQATLADTRVRSLLVEINTTLEPHRAIVAAMQDLGFTYSEAQASASRRSEGPFMGTGNYVFRR